MTHMKRQNIPKKWPLPKKGTTFVVRPLFELSEGIPVLILIRDILKFAQNRREVKRAINSGHILVNNKAVHDERHSVLLFDTLGLVPEKKFYRIVLSEKGKFDVEEIKEEEVNDKIVKIIDKKIVKCKRVQLNFSDGKNLLSDMKCNVGDSVMIDFNNKKVKECFELKKGARVVVFAGKHTGTKGFINDIKVKIAVLDVGKKSINVLLKQLMVIKNEK